MPVTMKERLFNLVVSNVISNAINIGNRLNLFKKLAEISSKDHPVLPEALAKAAGCKERYVREWCNCLACGEILEVNEKEEFWIAEENIEILSTSGFEMVSHSLVPTLLAPLEQLIECFKLSGPYGLDYSQFNDFEEMQSSHSRALHEKHVIPDLIPKIGNGVEEKLKKGGIRVLDVGCGNGFHSSLLAEEYPETHFVGLDIGEEAIKQATERKTKQGSRFTNLEFLVCDAAKMPKSWTDLFDLVLIFDACHDQTRPDLCIREIHRVLKPNGVFALIEKVGSSNVYQDKKIFGPMAAMLYGCSLFHCLPVGSNSSDALGYGSMWGEKRALELLNRCGFEDVEVVPTPFFPNNHLYLSKKTV